MFQLLIIADDLTGALDSAAAFACRGMRVIVANSADHVGAAMSQGAHVVAVNTGSREMGPDQAAQVMADICSVTAGYSGLVMKKVDSRLKGPIAAELTVLHEKFCLPIFASPAIPRLGRYVVEGHVGGAGVDTPISISSKLGCPAEIPDIRSDEDMDAALPKDVFGRLLVGAAGLTEALARRYAMGKSVSADITFSQPSLWAIGSRDPVTLAQVAMLENVEIIEAANGVVPDTDEVAALIIQMVEGADSISEFDAGCRFAEGVSNLASQHQFGSLFACGGETASAILARLGVGLLELEGEILPGVPVSRALDGVKGLQIVTKSGGFGARDTLQRLLAKAAT